MEPVALISPSNTVGLGLGISTPSSNQHYPAYLMGESQSTLSSCISPGSISPGRRTRQFSSSGAVSSPQSPQIEKEAFFPSRIGNKRQGGPPTLSLMGGFPQSPSARMKNSPFIEQQKIVASTPGSPVGCHTPGSHSTLMNLTPANQSANYYTPVREISHGTCSDIHVEGQSVEPLDATWVTVYGFPVASASYILTQFAHIGTIVDQRQPGVGNWMHLKYQTRLQARKALAKNSKIFNGNIMVGVVPCTDQALLEDKENSAVDQSILYSPRASGLHTTPKSMRPLTQAYQASRADIEVTPGSSTPKKNDGLISRAIQHILGV